MFQKGFTKENSKKDDGSDYELRDLFRLNIKNETPTHADEVQRENIFCEHCLIVINKPTKHCKLCGKCCSRFDHHCLFLIKCIGLNNHRMFILLLISSVTCIAIYLTKSFFYLLEQSKNLPEEAGNSFTYFAFASTTTIWLVLLFVTNSIALFMLSFLLFFQLNILSHGFTAQFRPYNLTNMNLSFGDKIKNLRIFFFESNDKLMELYVRQAKNDYIINKKYNDIDKEKEKLLGNNFINLNNDNDEFDSFGYSAGSNNKHGGKHGHNCSGHGHSH